MSLHIDERYDGHLAFFIDGDLQFDTADEALYHEALVLPALSLAKPAQREAMRVLICGGGDGLALRECLRFPGVSHVDVAELSEDVVNLGRTRFAALNQSAFSDPRVNVAIGDAWEFLGDARSYDAIVCDFTVPRSESDARVFTNEWYQRIQSSLAPGGVAALNGVSPELTPEAFWCLRKTVRSVGLSALPYRVCIPSFRDQGYGAWGFILAARFPIPLTTLRTLRCPIAARQADMARLWRGARFSNRERELEGRVPVHSLANPCLMELLLNPGSQRDSRATAPDGAPSLEDLLRAVPILHPYHVREMVEDLARSVAGSVKAVDIRQLADALLRRASELPTELRRQLRNLTAFLNDRLPRWEDLGAWAWRVFAVLMIIMTIANSISPDNAFAKGSLGLGHASISRGYSGGPIGTEGIFGGSRGAGSAGDAASAASAADAPHIVSGGFRGYQGYGSGRPTDIYGNSYAPRYYAYRPWGYGGGYYRGGGYGGRRTNPALGHPSAPQKEETHQAVFVADDDMLVMDNGDVIVTLSDSAYLLAAGGNLTLMGKSSGSPLMRIYPDPRLFDTIKKDLKAQQAVVAKEIGARRDWLSWVGWTSALSSVIREDKTELANLVDLSKRLEAAAIRVGAPAPGSYGEVHPADAVELFAGGLLMPDGTVALRQPDGNWTETDSDHLWSRSSPEKLRTCPPALAAALRSVMAKLHKEFLADGKSGEQDMQILSNDRASLANDQVEYSRIQAENGGDPSTEVDYGTDTMTVAEALRRTNADLAQTDAEIAKTEAYRTKSAADAELVAAALERFGG